jgi:hypothetical protein
MFSRVCRWMGIGGGVVLSIALGAEAERRPLTYADSDGWRSFGAPVVSRDGRWLAYTSLPQEGDGDVVIRDLQTGSEQRLPAGATPPPTFPLPESVTERQPPGPTVGLQFTSTSEFLLALTFPTEAEQAAARVAQKKSAEAPKRALLLVRLATGQTTRIERVKSVQTPAHGGNWAAYLIEPATEAEKPQTGAKSEGDGEKAKPEAKLKPAETTLVLRNLATGEERMFAHVSKFSFARDGRALLFTVAAPAAQENGLYVVEPGEREEPWALLSGAGHYAKLAWDRAQRQAAFLSDRDDAQAAAPRFKAYLWSRDEGAAREIVDEHTAGMPAGMTVSGNAAPEFSFDGRKLYLGVAPFPTPPFVDERDPEEKVTADIWSWKDGLIQPRQEVRADGERKRTYRGVFDLASQRYTQLADESLTEVTLSDDGRHAVGFDYRPYLRLRVFDGTYGGV